MEELLLLGAKKKKDAFKALKNMPRTRASHSMTGIDGKLYIAGGSTTAGGADIIVIDVYDIATDTWTTTGSTSGIRRNYGGMFANKANDETRIYYGGGLDGSIQSASLVSYIVETGIYQSRAAMGVGRNAFGSVFDPYLNRWWIGGGQNTADLKDVRYYNLETNTWTTAAGVTFPRAGGYIQAGIDEEYVYWVGGGAPSNYKMHKQTYQLTRLADSPKSIVRCASIQKGRNIYLIGNNEVSDEIFKYDLDADVWTVLKGDAGRAFGAACILDGKCYYTGGRRVLGGANANATNELFEIDVDLLLPY